MSDHHHHDHDEHHEHHEHHEDAQHTHGAHAGHVHHHHADAGPRLIWALLLTLGFAAVEAVTGFWSGSLALLGLAGLVAGRRRR